MTAPVSIATPRAILRDELERSALYEVLKAIADTADGLSISATIARAHVKAGKREATARYLAEARAALKRLDELGEQIGGAK